MISLRFNRAWRRLTTAFSRHQDTPRDPDDIATLGEARAELEEARDEARAARAVLGKRRRPASGMPRKVAVSEEDQAKLRVRGLGDANRA